MSTASPQSAFSGADDVRPSHFLKPAVFNLQLINKLNVNDETLLSKHISKC
jgi:hypothetical protein